MLTIQNPNKIIHKTLGKKNFYVERIVAIFDLTENGTDNHKYKIEITNRKYAITIFLDRTPVANEQNYYRMQSSTGHIYYVTSKQISNIDIFIDKLRFVAFN